MLSNLHDPDTEIRPLPKFGFGKDIDFNTLIESNHFIFRVFSPKEKSPFSDPSDPFFVAPKFDEQFTRSPVDLPDDSTAKFPELMAGSYSEVARHMEWTTRSTSPFISTSFSFSWSIWEAVRRYHFGVKKDVQIAIINASALKGRAATAVQLLRTSSLDQRDQQFWKWHRFSYDSQSVLVYGMIPRPAVLASIPITQILHKMPSYFLRKDIQILEGNPLDQAAWDYTRHKLSYRRFCQQVSKLFFSRPAEVRLRDCTAGSVRLALSFLRPFFHRVVQEDFDIAMSYLRIFALTISQWPSQTWVNDHPEIHQVVESMVLALAEELREKYRHQQQEEVSRLQIIIDGLQYAIKAQDLRTVLDNVEVDSDGDFEIEYEDEPTLVTMDAPGVRKRPSLELSIAVLPRMPISFQTPITPPESPSHSFFVPTVVVPIKNAITQTSKHVFQSQDGDKDQEISSSTSPELAEESSFSPPMHSSRSPVFSLPSPKSEVPASPDMEEKKLQDHAVSQICIIEQQLSVDQSNMAELEAQYNENGNEPLPDSPTIQWNPATPSPTLSSRRSSMVSIDTLCETSEFPSKRFSITSYNSDMFDPVPSLPIEIQSSSEHFSDPWPITSGVAVTISPPPETDLAIHVPLPPSPSSLSISVESTPPSLLSSPVTPQLHLEDLPLSSNSASNSVISRIGLIGPLPDAEVDEEYHHRSTTVVETASCIVTGFLVGTFITLFLFSTQRRTLLYLT